MELRVLTEQGEDAFLRSRAAEIMEKIGIGQDLEGRSTPSAPPATVEAERPQPQEESATMAMEYAVPANASSPANSQAPWQFDGASWHFVAEVPSLGSLSEGHLEISQEEVRLQGPDGSLLVCQVMPDDADASLAEARWSKRHRRISIRVPRCASASSEPAASALSLGVASPASSPVKAGGVTDVASPQPASPLAATVDEMD
mmetsp:Transcript_12185/g.25743  ORF Transcript_12185/g.25743 Transcript_12185/m.25743 type:complete len:202 (+) Transcript_12185:1-606(+)